MQVEKGKIYLQCGQELNDITPPPFSKAGACVHPELQQLWVCKKGTLSVQTGRVCGHPRCQEAPVSVWTWGRSLLLALSVSTSATGILASLRGPSVSKPALHLSGFCQTASHHTPIKNHSGTGSRYLRINHDLVFVQMTLLTQQNHPRNPHN